MLISTFRPVIARPTASRARTDGDLTSNSNGNDDSPRGYVVVALILALLLTLMKRYDEPSSLHLQ